MSKVKTENNFELKKFIVKNNAIMIFILLVVAASCMSSNFLTVNNIMNVVRQQVPYVLVAIGAMLVMMTGGIDLSSGAVLGVGSCVIALFLQKLQITGVNGLLVVLLITVIVGAIFGALSGFLVAYCKIAAFIATLAVMTIAQGAAYIATNGQPVRLKAGTPAADAMIKFGKGKFLGIPLGVYVALVFIIVFLFIVKKTAYGRLLIACGSNEVSVRLSGINVKRYKLTAYIIGGTLSSLAGTFVTCRAASATPSTTGGGYELDAIAAVVIGGASLDGGKASVLNTIIGVFIMAIIGNIMNLMSIAAYPQKVVKGVIIIAAVLLQKVGSRSREG